MFIVIEHINGQIDSDPFIVLGEDISFFKNGPYLIFNFFSRHYEIVENLKCEFLEQEKD